MTSPRRFLLSLAGSGAMLLLALAFLVATYTPGTMASDTGTETSAIALVETASPATGPD